MFLPPRIEAELVWYLTEFDGCCGLKSPALDAAPGCRGDVPSTPDGFGAAVKAGPPRRALGSLGADERGAIIAWYAWARATPAARRAAGTLGRLAAVIVLTPPYRAIAGRVPVHEGVARLQREPNGLELCRVSAMTFLRRACKHYCEALAQES